MPLLTTTLLSTILSFSPTYTNTGTLKLQTFNVCPTVLFVHVPPHKRTHACVRCLFSQFQHICHFLRYIFSKVPIWCEGLDLVASNKLLFQCCLCTGLHRSQLCGWPPVSPQGEPYIWLMWVTDHSWWRSPTQGHKVVHQLSCFPHFLTL